MENPINLPWYKRLHWQIFAAMFLGTVAGLIGGEDLVPKVGWLGEIFIKALKMCIVPLVFTSIISGVASVGGGRDVGRLFSKTLSYYVLTSGLAALTGLILVNLIQPGVGAQFVGIEAGALPEITTATSPKELLLGVVPENIVVAAVEAKMLAMIFFCIVFGITIGGMEEKHRTVLTDFFNAGFQAMMKLTGGIIKFAPIGVFGLMVRVVGESGFASFKALGLYMITIALGLSIHLFLTMPLVLMLLGRIRPSIHFRNMIEPMVMAFSTSSSAATLPVTMNAVENRVGVSNKVTSFVLPMGSTMNMDGTAVYECAGVLFIAQVLGADLSFVQQMIVVVTALLASIGAAAVPSAGLVIIFLVLGAVGLKGPEVDAIVGAMFAIDRPLDMARTTVNIFSDSCGAAIIARSEGEANVDREVVEVVP